MKESVKELDQEQADRILESTLEEALNRPTLISLAAIDKPVSPALGLGVISQVARALSEASDGGFVHKNLRPETILIKSHILPVVVNFDPPPPNPNADDWGLAYASPEQKAGKTLDIRSNIYTLGLILHELVYGSVSEGERPKPKEVSLVKSQYPLMSYQTNRVIDVCCAQEAWARYQDYDQFISAIDRALEAETTSATDATKVFIPTKKTARYRNETVREPKRGFSFDRRLLPVFLLVAYLLIFGWSLLRSWGGNDFSRSVSVFEQLPLLFENENSPERLTQESAAATATIEALQVDVVIDRTSTPFPTANLNTEKVDPPVAVVPTNTPSPTPLPPTATATTPAPTPGPTDTETPTPTNSPTQTPLPTSTGSPVPTSVPTIVPTNSPQPTNPPPTSSPPTPTPPLPPTATPPLPATPTPPIFPTSTPLP